jgi:hypothetical protein
MSKYQVAYIVLIPLGMVTMCGAVFYYINAILHTTRGAKKYGFLLGPLTHVAPWLYDHVGWKANLKFLLFTIATVIIIFLAFAIAALEQTQ